MLSQNYPNSSNPSSLKKNSILRTGLVKLNAFNLLGKKVTTLVYNEQSAGIYEISFDVSNLSSGVCFDRLEEGEFYQIKDIITEIILN